MEPWREEKPDSARLERDHRIGFESNPEGLQDIRATDFGRHGSISVLCDPTSRTGDDECRSGAEVPTG
jgi:hypothetical protein